MRSLDAELEGEEEGEGGEELDDQSITKFIYNDQGERVMKRGDENETAYINAFYVVRAEDDDDDDAFHSKHIFIGNSRIVSKIIPFDDDFGDDEHGSSNVAGAGRAGATDDWEDCPTRDTQFPRILPEDCLIQVYHPDHLGSTSHLTDRNGRQLEHNLYFPFGESWVSQHRNDDDDGIRKTPYRFTSKELDSETGLYYFGARYYDPRTSLWVSADPILNQYIDGSGNNGVYHPANLGLYNYTYHNPVLLSDPDGKLAWFVTGAIGAAIGSIAYVGRQLYVGEEITAKGLGASALTGLAFGTGAALLPSATAVVGAGLTGYSAGNVGMRAADYGDASPEERRAIQADAALTAVGMLGVRAVAKGRVTKGVGGAAQRLGLKLDDIPITNGVARAKINISDTLNPKDIGKLKDALRSRGATRAEIDTGLIANPKLDAFLRRRVQDGKPFNGGTVRPSTSKGSDFTIDFGL